MTMTSASHKALKRTLLYRAELGTITAEEAAVLLGYLKRQPKARKHDPHCTCPDCILDHAASLEGGR